jgi:hypothetical protein
MLAAAQEVAYIEVGAGQQHITLRHPPAPPSALGTGGGIGGGSVGCGPMDPHDPRAFRLTLTWLDRLEYQADDNVIFEMKLENTGTIPVSLPIYPHLADLQPADASQKFSYETLGLTLVVHEAALPAANAATVWLYGSPDHSGTMIQLPPGAWVRVRYSGPFHVPAADLRGDWQLANASLTWGIRTVVLHPGGSFTNALNRAVPTAKGPDMSLRVIVPTAAEAK